MIVMTNYHIKDISDIIEGLINNGIYSDYCIDKEIKKLEWISKKLNKNTNCDYIIVRTDNYDYINIEDYDIIYENKNNYGSFSFSGKICKMGNIKFLIEVLRSSIYLFFKNEEEALIYKNYIDKKIEEKLNG